MVKRDEKYKYEAKIVIRGKRYEKNNMKPIQKFVETERTSMNVEAKVEIRSKRNKRTSNGMKPMQKFVVKGI